MKSRPIQEFKETEIGKIPFDWQVVSFSEIVDVSGGSTPDTSNKIYWDGDIPWLTPKDITKNQTVHVKKTSRKITQLGLENGPRKIHPIGCVLMTSRAPVGIPVINDIPMAVNQGFIVIDCKLVDNHFLYYWIKNNIEYLKSASNGTTFLELSKSNFKILKISLPKNKEEEETIAKILSDLDAKIDTLQNQNKILEQIIQSIFKSWFVDFDGVTEFEDSELGKIPKGWSVDQLDHIAVFLNGLPLQKFRPIGDLFLPVIKIREMKNGISENTEKARLDLDEKYVVNNGDVLFSWSGTLDLMLWSLDKGALNQHIFKVTSETYPKWFYYMWIKQHLEEFRRIAEDKVTTMGHIQRHHLSEALVLIPKNEILKKMNYVMAPLFEKIIQSKISIENLIRIRDSLLPKLMSGELRV